MRPNNTANNPKAKWISDRKLLQEERAKKIGEAEDLKKKILNNTLKSPEESALERHLHAVTANNIYEGIQQVQDPRFTYGYKIFGALEIPDLLVDRAIEDYRSSLNNEFETQLKFKILQPPFSRITETLGGQDNPYSSKYLLKEKVGNAEIEIEIDCDYNYDLQRDFPSFHNELPKSKPFIGFGQLTQKAPSDELVQGFVNRILSGWYSRNEEKPSTVDELYSQNKKAYLLLNEGQHWVSLELIFEKDASGQNVVNVNYCNPAGSQQSSFSPVTESLVKKIVGCLEGFARNGYLRALQTAIENDKNRHDCHITEFTRNADVTEATNVQIKEKHLLKQATGQGCGPTAKANLALLMGDKVKIGNVKISANEILTEGLGLGLLPEDELRLRLQDCYEILKSDDQIIETRCGVDYEPIATLENLSPIKEYKTPASPDLPPPPPPAQQPSQPDEAIKQKQWHKKYGSIVKNPRGLSKKASRELTEMVTNFDDAQKLSELIQDIIAENKRLDPSIDSTKTTTDLFRDHLLLIGVENEFSQNIKNFFLNEDGSVKNGIFKNPPLDLGGIENVRDLLSKRAQELDPKRPMIKKLIKYQLAQVRDEENEEKKAYKIKTLRNLVNQSSPVSEIGIRNENPEDFLYDLFYMLYDDLPIVHENKTDNSYCDVPLAFLGFKNDLDELNISEAISNNNNNTFSIKEGVDEIIFNPQRFYCNEDGRESEKVVNNTILDDITLPIEGSENGETQVFEATAFICHKGSAIDNGKFVTYIKCDDKKWAYRSESGEILEVSVQELEDAEKLACAIKYSAKGRNILPVHQFEATDLDGNMSWATSAAIFAGSFTSLGLGEVSLTPEEIGLLERDSTLERLTKLKVSSDFNLNPDHQEIKYLRETFKFNYDEENKVHRIHLTEIRKSNVLRNGIKELVIATSIPIPPPIPKSRSQEKIPLSNLKENPDNFLNQKVLVKVGDRSNQQLSAIEAARQKMVFEIDGGNSIDSLSLNYAAKGILNKATKEPKKFETFDQVLWNKKSGSKNGKVGQKAWYQRYSNTDFKGVDFSKTLFMTRFVGCTFDENCKFPDLKAIKPEYFSNCFFHKDMFAKDASGNLKDDAKNLMKKFGINLSATANDKGFYEVAKSPSNSPKPIASFVLSDNAVDMNR